MRQRAAVIGNAAGDLTAGEAAEGSLHAIEVGKDPTGRSNLRSRPAPPAPLTPAMARVTRVKESCSEQHARLLAEEHQRATTVTPTTSS